MENFSFTNLAKELDAVVNGVSFEGKGLKWENENQVQDVINEINKCKKLVFLNLEGNSLGAEAAKAIGKALENHPEFEQALWNNLFTGRLKTEIPIALKEMGHGITKANAHLTLLDCSDNALGPNGMTGLVDLIKSPACYSLKELKLNNCGLGIQGGKMLATALLSCYEESVKSGTPLELKVFIAGRNRLENEGAAALSKVFGALKSLEEVVMPQNGIYHIGISALSEGFKENGNMRVLNLNDNTITEKGAESLAEAFAFMPNLTEVNFGDCLLKTKGAILIAEALEESHEELETLIMEANEIDINGGVSIASAMANKKNLKSLNLDSNQFGEEGCIAIQEIMEGFETSNCVVSLENDEGEQAEEEDVEGEGDDYDDEAEEDNETIEDDDYENEKDPLDFVEEVKGDVSKDTDNYNIEEEDDNEFDVNYIAQFRNRNTKECGDNTQNLEDSVEFVDSFERPNTIEAFVDTATTSLETFNELKETNKLEAIRTYLQEFKYDEYLIRLSFLVMKCSHISDKSQEAFDLAVSLYKDCFDYAVKTKQISRVRTFFLIQLGLLKAEDKSFKPAYNLKACRNVLSSAIEKKCIPEEAEISFKLFLEKFGK